MNIFIMILGGILLFLAAFAIGSGRIRMGIAIGLCATCLILRELYNTPGETRRYVVQWVLTASMLWFVVETVLDRRKHFRLKKTV
jgi:hypothetical protein